MKINGIAAAAIAFVLLGSGQAGGQAATAIGVANEAGVSAARLQRLDDVIGRLIAERRIPGAVTLIARRGEIVHLNAQGHLDVEARQPMRNDAIFRIYSMTKPVTSVAVMLLVEQGRIGLHDAVSDYLPALGDLSVYAPGEDGSNGTEPLQRPVTIHDLLTHTAGFTYQFFPTPLEHDYRRLGIMPGVAELNRKPTDPAPNATLAGMIEALAALPLLHQPGARFSYGINTDVLGRVVEVVTGKRLGEFFADEIFEPLGMRDTAFVVPSGDIARFGALYEHDADGRIRKYSTAADSRFVKQATLHSGGAGLVSTAADYFRFCQMLLNGGELDGVRLLAPATVALMSRVHVSEPADYWGEPLHFGLGFAVVRDIAETGDYGSTGTYAWGGAASTVFWIDPVEELIVVVMTQVMNPVDFRFSKILNPLVYQALID